MLWPLLVIVCVQVLLAYFSYEERNVNVTFFSTQMQCVTRIGKHTAECCRCSFFYSTRRIRQENKMQKSMLERIDDWLIFIEPI